METIRLRSRSREDGILHLDLPVTMKEVEWDVMVTIQPVAPPFQGKGYPAGFFEHRPMEAVRMTRLLSMSRALTRNRIIFCDLSA